MYTYARTYTYMSLVKLLSLDVAVLFLDLAVAAQEFLGVMN